MKRVVGKLLCSVAALLSAVPLAAAVEPVSQFVAALCERKYFDEAMEYLASLEKAPTADAATRQRLAYERAFVLADRAQLQRDPQARAAQLARAAESLRSFLAEHPNHELAASAGGRLARLTFEQALAEGTGKLESSRERTRKLLFESADLAKASEADLQKRLEQIPKLVPASDAALAADKQRLSADLMEARLLRPNIDYELARTLPAGGSEAKKQFRSAAASFAALYESYRTRSAGLLARLWEGRCYQEVGELKLALGCFRELAELPASPETRALRCKGVRHALECLTDDRQRNYQEAIELSERWDRDAGAPAADPDSMAIRYLTAVAYDRQANSLPAKDPNRKKLAGQARQFVDAVARQPGEYQVQAKVMLVALAAPKAKKDEKSSGKSEKASSKASGFAEAFEKVNDLLQKVEANAAQLQAARGKSDAAEIEKLEKEKSALTAQAVTSLHAALGASDAKTSIDDLNAARWYLCYFAWDQGNDYDAALMGEFLARRYPDSEAGRKGAKVALAAYVRMYGASKDDDKSFEADHVERMADWIFKQWPDREESETAAITMLNFAIAQKKFDCAVEYLNKIAVTSPRRAQAELRAGQALWSACLRAAQANGDDRPSDDELDKLQERAKEILEAGIAKSEKNEQVDATLVAAVLALAQIEVESGASDKAIQWLEKPKIGPLTLVKAGSPVVNRDAFITETYKLALRAYIAMTPQQLPKAEEVMDRLEKFVEKKGDAAPSINLTGIYISLGRELQQHLQALRKSGKNRELDNVSKAFEVFLDRVMKRETGASYASLNWVGETYYNLGLSFAEGGGTPSLKAPGFFEKSAAGYQRMLEVAEKEPKLTAQPDTLNAIRARIADCHRRSGKYEEAIQALLPVLKEKPTPVYLSAQVQAAETYQAEGSVKPAAYALAINGGQPGKDGKNVIWGWGKISKMTVNNPKLSTVFHQARLNMAEARYNFAMAEKDTAKQAKILEAAKQDLWYTYKLHPELGGPETAARYDRLLKQIQKSLGGDETGLSEFKQRDAEPAAT